MLLEYVAIAILDKIHIFYEEIRVMVVDPIQQIIWLTSVLDRDSASYLLGLPIDWTVLAQSVTDPDLMGTVEKAYNNFIKTGQGWALLIGLIIGYMIRSLTSYG